MSEEKENQDIVDSPKDNPTMIDSQTKTETPNNPVDELAKLKEENERLKGIVSGKDRKTNETQKTLAEVQRDLERIKEQNQMRDLLLESELPQAVKSELKKNIDSLNLETFESFKNTLIGVYESGKEHTKTTQSNNLSNTPLKKDDVDFATKLESASLEDLMKMDIR